VRRLSLTQYQQRVLVIMAVYSAFMLFAWPLLNTATNVLLKVLLALTPVVPMIYLIVLVARRIQSSDEFEQRTHLIALGVATAVTGALGLIGGFLSIAGVVTLSGSVLLWVFPIIMWSYSVVRWYVLRRYGENIWCDEKASPWLYLRFALIGVVLLVIALVSHRELNDSRFGFICGTGAGVAVAGIVLALVSRHRHRYRNE
jgi:hypothetical protein